MEILLSNPDYDLQIYKNPRNRTVNDILNIVDWEYAVTENNPNSSYRIFVFFIVNQGRFIFDDTFVKPEVVEELLRHQLIKFRGKAYHQGEVCIRYSFLGRKIPSMFNRGVNPALRRLILERDDYRCVNCGSHKNLVIDHRLPWSQGGYTEENNLQTLCHPCNSKKSNNNNIGY